MLGLRIETVKPYPLQGPLAVAHSLSSRPSPATDCRRWQMNGPSVSSTEHTRPQFTLKSGPSRSDTAVQGLHTRRRKRPLLYNTLENESTMH